MKFVSGRCVLEDDRDLRSGLRALYHRIVYKDRLENPVIIELPVAKWLSSNGLNMLVTFIEALFDLKRDMEVYVDLFDSETIERVINRQSDIVKDSGMMEAITRKIRFYDAMDLMAILRKSDVIVKPSHNTYEKMKETLSAYLEERKWQYSSRILSLNPLIENEEEQYALTTRLRTLTSILYQNLYGRIEFGDAEEASHQIMYELVKNVYQHAEVKSQEPHYARGFASAQINRTPIITNASIPHDLVILVLEQVKPGSKNKEWRYLSISISDFGVGLTDKVKEDLLKTCEEMGGEVRIGRFVVTKILLSDPQKAIEIAATTDYSSKKVRQFMEERWEARDKTMKLSGRGYGLIWVLSFLARTFGRMSIKCGNIEVEIFAKPEAPLAKALWKRTPEEVAKLLDTSFDNYFFITPNLLPKEESYFPGTQILIEIPVEVSGYRV